MLRIRTTLLLLSFLAVFTPVCLAQGTGKAKGTRLRSEPGELSREEMEKMVQDKGFRDGVWNPRGNFPNKYKVRVLEGAKVIQDRATGLMWQQSGSSHRMDWPAAKDYVEQLNKERYAGYSDWRLPTIEELASLLEPKRKKDLYIDPSFDVKQTWCWSADQVRASRAAWFANFFYGNVRGYSVTDALYVRAVRSAP